MRALTTVSPSPSGVVTAPQAVTVSGAPAASPSAIPNERPGHLAPLPKQTRGGDVRNAPFPPVRAVDHLANVHPIHEDGGEAA